MVVYSLVGAVRKKSRKRLSGLSNCSKLDTRREGFSSMTVSEVVKLREQLVLEEQAIHNGLYGLAAVANHRAIAARMQRGGEHILKLIQAGEHEEAQRLMELPSWGAEDNPPVPPPAAR
jgi:hypothetical protein